MLEEKKREYWLDNIRFVLIFLVVFAHFLRRAVPFGRTLFIYNVIYSFHMPAFIFLFGYFANFNPKHIVFKWIIPYIVFQTLYILFARIILNTDVSLQYTTPYWILWYMMACIFYQLLLPIYDLFTKQSQIIMLILTSAIALVVGLDNTVGNYMALSRMIVFQPWFLLGYYLHKNIDWISELYSEKKLKRINIVSFFFVCLSILFMNFTYIPREVLYGCCSYESSGSQTIWMRAIIMSMSLTWIVFLYTTAKLYFNRKYILITNIGQNTLPIFLFHGFIIRTLPLYCPVLLNSPLKVIIMTCLILLLFGNTFFKKIVYIISLSWLEKIWLISR